MRILFLGDMVGKPARRAVSKFLRESRESRRIDVVIANSDNLAHGRSVTRNTVEEMLSSGVDIMTCGDHAWDNSQAFDILKAGDLNFVAPANLQDMDTDLCRKVFEVSGKKILVINLMGRVFIEKEVISPFEVVEKILEENKKTENIKTIIVDFHAEATSEKRALGEYLAGRVSAVLGTHTHVQTADEMIIGEKMAYISDAGMCGVRNSILGCERQAVLDQFINNTAFKYKLAEEPEVLLEGLIIEIDEDTGKAIKVDRLKEAVFI